MKYTKRILSLLLSLTLVLGLLPAGVLAADNNSITVYVSVVDMNDDDTTDTGFQYGSDKNTTLMYCVPIQVSAGATAKDVMEKLHETYCADGTSGFDCSDSGVTTEFWGKDTSFSPTAYASFSYRINNHYVDVPTSVTVHDNDEMDCFLYAYRTTNYSYFDQRFAIVQAGQDLTLTLHNEYYDSSYNLQESNVSGAQILVATEDAGSKYFDPDSANTSWITNPDGQVSVSFNDPGTYELTAIPGSTGTGIVTPVCTVKVVDTAVTDKDILEYAAKNLTWEDFKGSNINPDEVTSGSTLPSTIPGFDGVTVEWSVDPYSIAYYVWNDSGTTKYGVDRPLSTDANANLIATIKKGDTTITKEFPLVIKAEGVNDKKESVVNFGNLMSGIAKNYSDDNGSGYNVTSAIDDNDLAWAVIDTKAYGTTLGAEMSRYTTALENNKSTHKFVLAEVALGHTVDGATISTDVDIYGAPYNLLARYACGITSANENQALIECIVNYLNSPDQYATADTVGAALAGIAPYNNAENETVQSAVNAGIEWLSSHQNNDGTFSSGGISTAESTAMVIVGLSAVGVDAHTDSRFIKNYKSAVEGLLSFALADYSGFGHKGNVTYNGMGTEQGFRALVAYARYKESGAYNIYLQAKDSSKTVSAPDISATVVPSTPSNPEKQIQVSATVDALGETWATGSYTVKANTTVGVVLNKLFAANGITCVGLDVGYISSVTKNGVTLKEKDKGTGSGWMYRVNGVMPNVGVNDYKLSDGDTISFFYTTDYTKEDGAQQDTSTTTTPAFSDVSAGSYYADAVEWAVKKGITVGTSDTTFSPDDNCTREQMAMFLWKAAGSPEPKQTGTNFTDLPGGSTAKAMLWVAEQNITSGTSDTTFSPETTCTRAQMAAFLYRYAGSPAVSGTCAFADVSAEAYYHDAVLWCVHQSITAGTGGEKFSPDAPCTRGQMVTFLYRFLENHS